MTLKNLFQRFCPNPDKQAERLRQKWSTPFSGISVNEILSLLSPKKQCWPATDETIDVIIPVYNGLPHLQRLFPLLFANTSQPHRFIIVNDCSPDPRIRDFIMQKIQGRDDCVLLENASNLGFTATVNRGATLVNSKIFVLLNTDVMVPPMWLERLIAPFRQDKKIGTVTPFTNGGSYYSFPNMPRDHALLSDEEFLRIDEAFQTVTCKETESLEFINGTGFCMAIRKLCWDCYGGLDEQTFGKGYGEECDLSFRYLERGYKNILVPYLFVYHKHGGSFQSEERKKLSQEHGLILAERWGKYIQLIPSFVTCDPWAPYRLAALCRLYAGKIDHFFNETVDEGIDFATFSSAYEQEAIRRGECVVTLFHTTDSAEHWYLTFPNRDGRAVFRMSNRKQAEEWVELLKNPLPI